MSRYFVISRCRWLAWVAVFVGVFAWAGSASAQIGGSSTWLDNYVRPQLAWLSVNGAFGSPAPMQGAYPAMAGYGGAMGYGATGAGYMPGMGFAPGVGAMAVGYGPLGIYGGLGSYAVPGMYTPGGYYGGLGNGGMGYGGGFVSPYLAGYGMPGYGAIAAPGMMAGVGYAPYSFGRFHGYGFGGWPGYGAWSPYGMGAGYGYGGYGLGGYGLGGYGLGGYGAGGYGLAGYAGSPWSYSMFGSFPYAGFGTAGALGYSSALYGQQVRQTQAIYQLQQQAILSELQQAQVRLNQLDAQRDGVLNQYLNMTGENRAKFRTALRAAYDKLPAAQQAAWNADATVQRILQER
ncbi:MAG: hypothetical protein JSS27_01230 [Planctomycetes bacterium]|nr:hypothetical protein [Planctomycetota bacterium]